MLTGVQVLRREVVSVALQSLRCSPDLPVPLPLAQSLVPPTRYYGTAPGSQALVGNNYSTSGSVGMQTVGWYICAREGPTQCMQAPYIKPLSLCNMIENDEYIPQADQSQDSHNELQSIRYHK